MAPSTPHQRHAFTLIEVLIAAGIFAIGLIAVAAIFPTAIQLQKQTFEEIRGDEFSKTVRALVLQRGFDERLVALRAEAVTTDPVMNPTGTAVPRVTVNGRPVEPPTVFTAQRAVLGSDNPPLEVRRRFGEAQGWSMTDRSAGSLDLAIYTNGNGALGQFSCDQRDVSDPTGTNGSFDYGGRNLFWSPVFIDYDENVANPNAKPAPFPNVDPDSDPRANRKWGVFVFVLRADPNSDYERLEPASGSVRDIALNNNIDVRQDLTLDTPPQGCEPLVSGARRV